MAAIGEHMADCPECQRLFHDFFQKRRAFAPVVIDLSLEKWLRDEHLDYEWLTAYVDDAMEKDEREMTELHLQLCDQCREEVEEFIAWQQEIKPELKIRYTPDDPASSRKWVLGSWDWLRIIRKPAYAFAVLLAIGTAITLAILLLKSSPNSWDGQQANASPSPSVQVSTTPIVNSSPAPDLVVKPTPQIRASPRTQSQQAAFEEAKRAFLAARAQMRELEGRLQGRESLTLALQDIRRKLARFEGADHAAVLKNYQRTSRQSRELERQFEASAELAARLTGLAGDLLAEDLPEGLFDTNEDGPALSLVQALHAAIAKARQEVESTAAGLLARRQVLRGEMEASPWFVRIDAAKAAYDQLKADLQQQGVSDPSEYGRLVQENQRLEAELKRLETLQKQHADLREKTSALLEQVQSARRAIGAQRSTFLRTTLQGNPFVRIELIPYSRDAQGIERSLRELLGAADGKYVDDLYQEQEGVLPRGLVADLLETFHLGEQDVLDTAAFEQALRAQKSRLLQACRGQAEFGGWFNKFLKAEADKRPEFIDHILCWFPEDGLQVEYSRKGDGQDFQSIGQASAGQRAAAMLAFLLAHGNEPLVLDQPEDDLDNHLIYGLVVQQIRSNKLRRQLIIVTHNPNIVVNGDAELIHVLDFNHQCHVKQTGSLQDKAMRSEVCQVMEGGEEAFERRYQRLGREV